MSKFAIIRHRRRFTTDVSFTFRMPAGIPGDVNRAESAIIEPQAITSIANGGPSTYGIAVLIDATTGLVRLPTTGDTGVYGFLVRPYPAQDPTQTPALGISGPSGVQAGCSVLKQGYISVALQNTTAAVKDGTVYVRISGTSGTLFAGGVEAAAGSGLIALTNAYFMGPADSGGITEIAVGLRQFI